MSPPPIVFKTMSFESPVPSPLAAEVAAVGPRLVAGAIDLVGGAALFVLVAASAGTLDTSHGFVARLDGAPAFLWIALVLLASFLAEVLNDGQTLGKAVLGLRVVRERDGGPPSTRAFAVRTLLRLVDAFPLFYALGAFIVLVTPKRRRLGDLAARTVVVRDPSRSGRP